MKRTVRQDHAFEKRQAVFIDIPVPQTVAIKIEPGARAYRRNHCIVIVGHTPFTGWHLSISHPARYPTWDEIADARYTLVPDNVTMAMILPPKAEYINLHPNCFHLHEIRK